MLCSMWRGYHRWKDSGTEDVGQEKAKINLRRLKLGMKENRNKPTKASHVCGDNR